MRSMRVEWLTYDETAELLGKPKKSIGKALNDDRLAGVHSPSPQVLLLDGKVQYRGRADETWTSNDRVVHIGPLSKDWPTHVRDLLTEYDAEQRTEVDRLLDRVEQLEQELEQRNYELQMFQSEMYSVTAERDRLRQERDAARHRERVAKDLALQATRAFSEDVVEIVESSPERR